MTASEHLQAARHAVDKVMGEGAADSHPELVAAIVQAEAILYGTTKTRLGLDTVAESLDGLRDSLSSLHEPMRSDHPLQGETFDGIRGAIADIADALDRVANTLPEFVENKKTMG